MTGTIALYMALYSREDKRLYTIYLGSVPEVGKTTLLARLTREIERMKIRYPQATFIGVADGTQTHRDCLKNQVSVQILDFYHASGYLAAAATAAYPEG